MNTTARIALTAIISTAVVMAAPFLSFAGHQSFNSLIWQMSTVLPYGMVGPVAWLIMVTAVSLIITILTVAIARIWKK
jgi:branched-subunit amino acid transport protein AzlD